MMENSSKYPSCAEITILILIFLFLTVENTFAQLPEICWTRLTAGTNNHPVNPKGCSIALDGNGYIYAVGRFGFSATFDNITLTGIDEEEMFIAKFDEFGNVLWAAI